jgi:uncharacterized protein GlcG (DUF336 family)
LTTSEAVRSSKHEISRTAARRGGFFIPNIAIDPNCVERLTLRAHMEAHMTKYSRTTETLTLAGAERVAQQASEKATLPVCIVVVDANCEVMFAKTADGTPPGSFHAALLKAKGAARSGTPTHLIAEFVKTLPPAIALQALSLPDVCAFQGGVPIKNGMNVIGGVGIAGGSGEQDIEIATHASLLV